MIAALFVDGRGIYSKLGGVDCWDKARDARLYAGPWPVVAHPPCQLWVNLARVNYKRWGGEHNRPGNDGGCFAAAVASVRKYGGVLEHPASSWAWPEHGLRRPAGLGWDRAGANEWVCEVWQSAYGHRARKRTWLLFCGDSKPHDLRWDRPTGVAQCGHFDRIKPVLGKREASATPSEFADELLSLAREARRGT